MKCNLITDLDNVVGLNTDLELMRGLMSGLGYQCIGVHWRHTSEAADINIYLEKFHPKHLDTAKHHIGIFNLEWFDPSWVYYLPRFSQLWAKSTAAYEWYVEHGFDQAVFTGFASRDPYDGGVKRERKALHVAGKSSAKNTTEVVRAYWDYGDALPPLVIVSELEITPLPSNVMWSGWLSDHALRILMNACRFHLCPSSVEGWGHYIAEATACGGIVVTTDAPPMNEHILPTFGKLLSLTSRRKSGLVTWHDVAPVVIAFALIELSGLSDAELDVMGGKARAWNKRRNAKFVDIAYNKLKELS